MSYTMQELSPREQDIVNLLIKGVSPKEIGFSLGISYETVITHQKKLYRKLGINSLQELLVRYLPQNPADGDAGDALGALPLPSPFVLVPVDHTPYGWSYNFDPDVFQYDGGTYPSPFKLGKGNRLVKDEIYHVTCFVSSDVDIVAIHFAFIDTTLEEDEFFTELSGYYNVKRELKANVKYSLSAKIIITRTASGATPAENKLHLNINQTEKTRTTLTFHKFEVVKLPYLHKQTARKQIVSEGDDVFPSPFALTLNANEPWDWCWSYYFDPDVFEYDGKRLPSPFRLGKGNRIVEGDIFLVNLFFTSDADIDFLQFIFVDTTIAADKNWTELSPFQRIAKNIRANIEYTVTLKVIATATASGASPAENRFVLQTGLNTEKRPTLTFTKFEVVKIP